MTLYRAGSFIIAWTGEGGVPTVNSSESNTVSFRLLTFLHYSIRPATETAASGGGVRHGPGRKTKLPPAYGRGAAGIVFYVPGPGTSSSGVGLDPTDVD